MKFRLVDEQFSDAIFRRNFLTFHLYEISPVILLYIRAICFLVSLVRLYGYFYTLSSISYGIKFTTSVNLSILPFCSQIKHNIPIIVKF